MSPRRGGLPAKQLDTPSYGALRRSDGLRYWDLRNFGYQTGGTSGGVAAVADVIEYWPFFLREITPLDQLTCEVTGAGAASTLRRMDIYNADFDWQPTSLIVDSGTFAVDSTGFKDVAITETLSPGRYLFCWNTDGTPTTAAMRTPLFGYFDGDWTSNQVAVVNASQTFAAFPASGLAWTGHGSNNNGALQRVLARVARRT